MRKTLRKRLPDHSSIQSNRWLRPFANTLLHPRLWHLNRHSVAGAVAVGLFCGLVPGPLQMLSAAIACMFFRVNLPLALITTLYTNPLTIVPLYLLAYALGSLASSGQLPTFIAPPERAGQGMVEWASQLAQWAMEMGQPLLIGLVLLGSLLAVSGYFAVRAAWRVWLIRAWRRRQQARSRR